MPQLHLSVHLARFLVLMCFVFAKRYIASLPSSPIESVNYDLGETHVFLPINTGLERSVLMFTEGDRKALAVLKKRFYLFA